MKERETVDLNEDLHSITEHHFISFIFIEQMPFHTFSFNFFLFFISQAKKMYSIFHRYSIFFSLKKMNEDEIKF